MSAPGARAAWLFSPAVDLWMFAAPALAALVALALGARFGLLDGEAHGGAWIAAVLLVDVAHVWATGYRVYLDAAELRRRPALYFGVPIAGLVAALALYQLGEPIFWRVLAYLAVWHFVRQQYGWVALYRRRAGGATRAGRIVDDAAIYLATIYPLVYWHTRLPRAFAWFVPGDFAALPVLAERLVRPLWAAALAAYATRALWLYARRAGQPGKDVVVASTALLWWLGIVVLDSDYAFTVTNVLIHGVPYFVLVYRFARGRAAAGARALRATLARGPLPFLLTLWAAAYVEELLWDRTIWHERAWLFGGAWEVGAWRGLWMSLLALPQLTHYVLDAFLWRRRDQKLAS